MAIRILQSLHSTTSTNGKRMLVMWLWKEINLMKHSKVIWIFLLSFFIFSCYSKEKYTSSNTFENTNTSSVQITQEPTTETINKYFSVISNEGLNVRKIPSLNSAKIGILKYNQIVRATKKTSDLIEIDGVNSNWFYINYHNLTGWVFGGYLKEVEIPVYELSEINSVIYNDFKTSYEKLKPEMFCDNWIGFYIFAYDEINNNQKIEMLMNDLDVIIKDNDYEIISGLYKDIENNFGAFIAKVVPTRDKVIDVYEINKVTDEAFLKIVFMQKNNEMIYLTNEFRKPFVFKFNPTDLKNLSYYNVLE